MSYSNFVIYNTIEEYEDHYKEKYCMKPIKTFDNFFVYFYEDRFDHAFYESSDYRGSDDVFSNKRAERIDWIEKVLQDPNAELYMGYDKKRKVQDNKRRVSIINEDNYVVVIQLTRGNRAKFITAFVADSPHTARNIRSGPKWKLRETSEGTC